jgi:transcriptional regulator with XRE-family HTH domain
VDVLAEAVYQPRTLGEALVVLLRRANLAVPAFALETGISRTVLFGYLSGDRIPDPARITVMAIVLAHHLGEDEERLTEELASLNEPALTDQEERREQRVRERREQLTSEARRRLQAARKRTMERSKKRSR